ncbi:MAG TPA: anti-sigma factor [Gaiellaceae bacterium]|nr:anti-sigma factor [Gaiellaceae bacterium]
MSTERPDDHELEQTFSALEAHLPRVSPRADLFDEIERSIETDRTPAAAPAAARPRRRPRRWLVAGLTAAAVAATVLIVALLASSNGESPAQRSAIVAKGGTSVHGSVEVFAPQTAGGHVVLHLAGLQTAPAGNHYTVWVLRVGATEMTPIGSFADGRRATFTLPLPGPGAYRALDISLQRNDASPVHSAQSVAGATLG